MKILFINIQNCGARPGYSGLFLPFGMAYISAVLKNNGYAFDCIDLHNEEILSGRPIDSWEKVKSFDISKYDVVAFGGTFLKFKILKLLSGKIWEVNKNIFQIIGGNLASNIPDIILRETKVNCVCLFEGEETIIELLNNLEKQGQWRQVKGIKYINEDGQVIQTPPRARVVDLDKIPFPDRRNWPFRIIRKAFPYGSPGRYCAVMFASRGCPFSCIFCSSRTDRQVYSRSAENIIEEIIYLKHKWNIGYIRFFDEIFIGSKDKIKRLCGLMIEKKLNIFWFCQTQIKLVDEETLKAMKEAGCIEISYGIESGSDIILSEMKKRITKELAKKVIEMTYRIGIKPSLNLLAGTPSETYETLQETQNFVKSLNYINWIEVPSIDLIVPLPNTELYTIAKNKGFIADEQSYLTEELPSLGKKTKSINLTKIPDTNFISLIRKCNEEIARDFYAKHPEKRILAVFGFDHLRLDLIFKNFSFRQILPIMEALFWAAFGKRNNFFSRPINHLILKRIYA